MTKRRKGKRGKKRGEAIRKRDSGRVSKATFEKKPDQRNGWRIEAGRRARGGSGRARTRKSYLLRVSFCIKFGLVFSVIQYTHVLCDLLIYTWREPIFRVYVIS